MSEGRIALTRYDEISEITLNRPKRLNAIDAKFRDEIRAALTREAEDPSVRAVLITGMGRAFCSGQDVDELEALGPDGAAHWIADLWSLYYALRCFPKPILAAVNGIATGAGFQLALHCDVRIGSENARFAQTEIDVGLPSILGPWIMERVIGIAATTEMSLSGRFAGPDEAEARGILLRQVEHTRLLEEARAHASQLAAKPPQAIRETKKWLQQLHGPSFEQAKAIAIDAMEKAFRTGEPQERIRLFRERARKS